MRDGRFWKGWRPAPLIGAGLLLVPLFTFGPMACGGAPPDTPDLELEGARAVGLKAGRRLHRVILGGRGSDEHLLPQRIQAEVGDAIEFVTVDHRVHAINFLRDSIPPDLWTFLTSTGQEASPPLLTQGASFILLLEDAPPGRYLFRSRGHGGDALGVIQLGLVADTAERSAH